MPEFRLRVTGIFSSCGHNQKESTASSSSLYVGKNRKNIQDIALGTVFANGNGQLSFFPVNRNSSGLSFCDGANFFRVICILTTNGIEEIFMCNFKTLFPQTICQVPV